MANSKSQLTGRDGYIIGQALYWFVRAQQELERTDPRECKGSDMQDAAAILLHHFPSTAHVCVDEDLRRGREPASLPDGF